VLPDTGAALDHGAERATRIELAFSAWEADVLPLNYARVKVVNVAVDFVGVNRVVRRGAGVLLTFLMMGRRAASRHAHHASGASSAKPWVTKARRSSEPVNGAPSASARSSTSPADAPARSPA
jgi:hypothetical protein